MFFFRLIVACHGAGREGWFNSSPLARAILSETRPAVALCCPCCPSDWSGAWPPMNIGKSIPRPSHETCERRNEGRPEDRAGAFLPPSATAAKPAGFSAREVKDSPRLATLPFFDIRAGIKNSVRWQGERDKPGFARRPRKIFQQSIKHCWQHLCNFSA